MADEVLFLYRKFRHRLLERGNPEKWVVTKTLIPPRLDGDLPLTDILNHPLLSRWKYDNETTDKPRISPLPGNFLHFIQ